MNWLPKDLGTWAFWISVFTLFVALPFTIVGNLLTPRVRNWWAERSGAGLKKRIAELENDLAQANKYQFISQGEDFILSIIAGVVAFTGGICASFWGMTMYIATALPPSIKAVVFVFGFFGLLFILGFGYFIPHSINRFLKRTSLIERTKMEKDIEALSGKLKALEKS